MNKVGLQCDLIYNFDPSQNPMHRFRFERISWKNISNLDRDLFSPWSWLFIVQIDTLTKYRQFHVMI